MIRALLPLAMLASCAAVPPGEVPPDGAPLAGRWGGEHVGLTLDAAGGTLDYDCAAGTIAGPVIAGRDGGFSASGTHSPGHGGPEQVGETHASFPARYEGNVRGDRMTLTVRVDNGTVIGPYSLRRGAEPVLLRCL
ncbi:hypothetical protein [Sphingomonas sp.]|uniref:hypothetical protein n=1 Tax=Sphingomonas sp. TaxID=28214 RepID=UPI00286D8604|nr:hypothetical protein [Sphingomonas sp.]